jgi:primosomal protein N''
MQKHASTIATKKPRFEASLTTRRRQLYEVSLDELNRMLSSLSDPEDAWQHLPNERWAYLVQNLVFRALELSNVNNWDS